MYNKTQLMDDVFAKGYSPTKVGAEELVNFVFDTIKAKVAKGEKVYIAGFGIFNKRATKARMARNPKTGAPVKLKASSKVSFKVAQAFKDAVAK